MNMYTCWRYHIGEIKMYLPLEGHLFSGKISNVCLVRFVLTFVIAYSTEVSNLMCCKAHISSHPWYRHDNISDSIAIWLKVIIGISCQLCIGVSESISVILWSSRKGWWLTGRRQAITQCWNIVNWTVKNKLQWNFNGNSYILNQENAFENVGCEMKAILSRPQCVYNLRPLILYNILSTVDMTVNSRAQT